MTPIVLLHAFSAWNSTLVSAAQQVATLLQSRVLPFGARPHLGMYDLVVLVASPLSLLDPLFHAPGWEGEFRGKTVALLTDAPSIAGEPLFKLWKAWLRQSGGAIPYQESLHLGPALGDFSTLSGGQPDRATRLVAWAETLALDCPDAPFPRGAAGARRL
ncbi:MAG: hypothetical protein VKP62_09060 [Candidatus Sericytochromatia bacterium]|nr:hypothetical protein [Candidatus Sericytochromatia bacterium]